MPPASKPDPALIRTIERDLAAAEQEVASLCASLAQMAPSPEALEASHRALKVAFQRQSALERQLAAAQGLPYLIPCELPVRPCTGAPLPAILATGLRTTLIFYCGEPNESFDGTTVRIAEPEAQGPLVAIVRFTNCSAHKLGSPNDEVWKGHPLHRRGFDPYGVQQVVSSPWIAELEAINSVHDYYNPSPWRDLNHYIFWFHDENVRVHRQGPDNRDHPRPHDHRHLSHPHSTCATRPIPTPPHIRNPGG